MNDSGAVDVGRAIRAMLASAATGLVVYWGVIKVALPRVAARLTPEQIGWLRQAFQDHPFGVLAAIALFAAVVALPVLLAFRIVYGPIPLRRTIGRRD